MFFQINVTPKEKKPKESKNEVHVNNYNLLLAPFQPPTRIVLHTNINTQTECKLTIKNTNKRILTVSVIKSPPEERCIRLSDSEWSLEPESSATLNILWKPTEAGSWRDILQLSDSRRIKYDVSLTLTCSDPNKVYNGKSKKGGGLIVKQTKINNSKKYHPTHKKITNNDNKEKVSKNKVQSSINQTTLTAPQSVNKENISSNVDCNWMLEQAKAKQQKKELSPPQFLSFSKFLDTSTFKFTPVKTPCFESDVAAHNTVTFLPKNDIENIDESWLFEKETSTVKIGSKVQMTLRKETYLKIPKFIDVQNESLNSEKINNDNCEEFDDSLSPKSNEIESEKLHSEFSMILNDLKLTPFKNSHDNIKFSPNLCSTVSKFDKNKPLNDDLFNQENNATFSIDNKDNTFELSTSPTSTKNSFHLKPTCLAKTFDMPITSNNYINATNDGTRISNQFSKSQMDFGSAKECLEADLWVKSKNSSSSPISKSIMHSTLDSIKEEDLCCDDFTDKKHALSKNCNQESEKSTAFCLEISPPKIHKKSVLRKISPTKYSKIRKEKSMAETIKSKKKLQINESIKSIGKTQIPGVRITKLSLTGLSTLRNKDNHKSLKKPRIEVGVKLHDPNDFLTMFCNPDPFAATMTHDPFLTSTFYYDDKWIYEQELAFKKWLNALLTPPEHLATDDESTTIDIGKVWQSCRSKENVTLAETKETVSARYHTNTRLNTLRKAACVMFRKAEVITALTQTTVGIEKEILVIRIDRDLHRDIGLQKIVLELFISYNPLWLRIGLETVYGETIPLQSNNDIIGLSRFLINRFFSDPFLVKMHSANSHPNIRLGSFQPLMNKFMLKKFLFLVYFLDYAKRNKLIGHDPCLFRKRALIKDSRSMLLTFSRELLSGIGDITKVLRNYNYVVSHKQSYLDEYDYAVKELSTDLRDGVRLCRVMELITGKRCLTCQCRVPAISRLQKVHNVNISLSALKEAGYTITGEIDGKSIADGHKEKTLSLLWQIIYKFQAPRFEKAAKTLQRWWRSKLYYVRVKNLIRNRKNNAASVIQRAWRCYLARKQLFALKQQYAQQLLLKINAALLIQSRWRLKKEAERQRREFNQLKESIIQIQKFWRRFTRSKPYVEEFKRKRQLIVVVQRRWRANLLMKRQRALFLRFKANVSKIQRFWRDYRLAKQIRQHYQAKRTAVKTLQAKWRGILLMRKERSVYLKILHSIKMIQERWKARLVGKKERHYFLLLKRSVRTVEILWIAKKKRRESEKTLSLERREFLRLKSKAILIQKNWRNKRATKKDVEHFKQKKNGCIKIQTWWRRVILARNARRYFLAVKKAALIVQKIWRIKLEARRALAEEEAIKESSALTIQHWYKNILAGRLVRREYLKMKTAVRVIESRRLALKLGIKCRKEYDDIRRLTIFIQQKWRAQIVMKEERIKYLQVINALGKIQSWWRMIREKLRYKELLRRVKAALVVQRRWKALIQGRIARAKYLDEKSKIIFIQRKWRASLLARIERNRYLTVQRAVLLIQRRWRFYMLAKKLERMKRMKEAVKKIELCRIHKLEGRKRRDEYLTLKAKVITLQRIWRSKLARRLLRKQINSAITLQKHWRAYKARKTYKSTKSAALLIQRWRRNLLLGRKTRYEYLKLKESTIKIQSCWRAIVAVKNYKRKRRAIILIQSSWRRCLAVKEFKKKKAAVLLIERYWKHYLNGRAERRAYLRLKLAAVKIQELLKVKKIRSEFNRKREAAIKIQRFWRSLKLMRECRMQYLQVKNAAIVIQQRYRGELIKRQFRRNYLDILSRIVMIQNWWRGILEKRRRRLAVACIENWYIQKREERLLLQIKRAEFKRKCRAATTIQAAWKGFKVRQAACKKMALLRERAQRAAMAAVPTATLAFRLQEAIQVFMYASSIGQLSVCLSSLDVITRLSPNACISLCRTNLVSKLYYVLTQANRSLPWLDVCLKVISILLTLAKFNRTTSYVLKEEYVEPLARLLTVSIDKKEDLFLHTATLLWILLEDQHYAEALNNCSRSKYLLSSLCTSTNKKLAKTATQNIVKAKVDALPSPKPDWGLSHKRPRTFTSISQAVMSIATRLNILNDAQTADLQRSFNFPVLK